MDKQELHDLAPASPRRRAAGVGVDTMCSPTHPAERLVVMLRREDVREGLAGAGCYSWHKCMAYRPIPG